MELRPLGIAEILDCTVEAFWKRFPLFIGTSLVIQCPAYFIINLGFKSIEAYVRSAATLQAAFAGIIISIPLLFLMLTFYFLTKGAVSVICSSLILNTPIGLMTSIEKVMKKALSISAIAIVNSLLSILLFAFPAIIIVTTYWEGRQFSQVFILLLVSTLVALLLWIWVMVKLCLAVPSAIIEEKSAIAALRRSWALTGLQWWKSGIIWLLVHSVIFAIGFALLLFNGLTGILYLITVFPFATIAESFLLYDSKIRSEAFDLEWRAMERRRHRRTGDGSRESGDGKKEPAGARDADN